MLNFNTLEINLKNIVSNASYITNKYKDYKWFIGVVKASAYGCGYLHTIEALEKGGINFFAVSSLDEALEVRKYTKKGILILTPVDLSSISICVKNDISIIVDDINYINQIHESGLKIHIKLNTGMNRFGTNDIDEIKEIIKYASSNNIIVEGMHTHIYHACKKELVDKQIEIFESLISKIDYSNIPMIHVMNSESLCLYPKFKYTNGVRIGDLLYGLTYEKEYKSVFRLKSKVIKIRTLHKGENLGYDSGFTAPKDTIIGIVPLGYAEGVVKANKGREIYINNKPYKIIGNICMGHMFVELDESIKLYDEANVINDSIHVMDIAEYLHTAPSEITCIINRNMQKEYIK